MNPQIESNSGITPENLPSKALEHSRRCAVERIRFVSAEISTKKLSANRSNALKSTGPRTPEGRAVSKMNALKHGIFSNEVLVRGLNARECSRGLDALYEVFRTQYQPVGRWRKCWWSKSSLPDGGCAGLGQRNRAKSP